MGQFQTGNRDKEFPSAKWWAKIKNIQELLFIIFPVFFLYPR